MRSKRARGSGKKKEVRCSRCPNRLDLRFSCEFVGDHPALFAAVARVLCLKDHRFLADFASTRERKLGSYVVVALVFTVKTTNGIANPMRGPAIPLSTTLGNERLAAKDADERRDRVGSLHRIRSGRLP